MNSDGESGSIIAEKFPQVIFFNCGETGHFSTGCTKLRVCFLCYSKEHVVEKNDEWKKPQLAAQYYGSASKGLGFYHIDVAAREDRFRH